MSEDARQYASLYNIHPHDVVMMIKFNRLSNQLLATLPQSHRV